MTINVVFTFFKIVGGRKMRSRNRLLQVVIAREKKLEWNKCLHFAFLEVKRGTLTLTPGCCEIKD